MKSALLKFAGKTFLWLGATIAVLGIALKAPQWHASYIRSKVGSQVVMLTTADGHRGGTGFAIKTPNGQVLTLTNSHICSLGEGNIFATVSKTRKLPLHIIERSLTSDLCLLSGVARMQGLSVADSVSIGSDVEVVGHPKLLPLTQAHGQLIGYVTIQVATTPDACEQNFPGTELVPSFFGMVCVQTMDAAATNAVVQGGNSGSPTVNFWGDIVGVLFAGDELGWGYLVPLKDVKAFLADY